MNILTKQQRYDRLRSFGCVCCRQSGVYNDQVDMHHLVDKGNRKASGGDKATLPLCVWHHRGMAPDGYTVERATLLLGPSFEHNRRDFNRVYGTQRELLQKVDLFLYGRTAKTSIPREESGDSEDVYSRESDVDHDDRYGSA